MVPGLTLPITSENWLATPLMIVSFSEIFGVVKKKS